MLSFICPLQLCVAHLHPDFQVVIIIGVVYKLILPACIKYVECKMYNTGTDPIRIQTEECVIYITNFKVYLQQQLVTYKLQVVCGW